MTPKESYYMGLRGCYLGHCDAYLELQRSTPDEVLLKYGEPLNSAFIIVSAVTGLESYLRDRLSRAVLGGDSNVIDGYINLFNSKFCQNNTNNNNYLDIYVPPGGHLTDEERDLVLESLNKQVYHKTKVLDGYFKRICGFSIRISPHIEKVNSIIDLRNLYSHDSFEVQGYFNGYSRKDNRPTYSLAAEVLDTISDYIKAIDDRFIEGGFGIAMDDLELKRSKLFNRIKPFSRDHQPEE